MVVEFVIGVIVRDWEGVKEGGLKKKTKQTRTHPHHPLTYPVGGRHAGEIQRPGPQRRVALSLPLS